MFRSHVMVCGGTGCTSSGSGRIVTAFERELEAAGFCTCDGRVSRRYFDKRYGLEAMA